MQQRIVDLGDDLARSEAQLLVAAERLQALRDAKVENERALLEQDAAMQHKREQLSALLADSDSDEDTAKVGGAIAMLEKLRVQLDAQEEELGEIALSTKAAPGDHRAPRKQALAKASASPTSQPADGPDMATIDRLLRWEMVHQLDEEGSGGITVGPSHFPGGGLGAFATSKPAPIEYKRDLGAPNEGWLTQEECDAGWEAKTKWSTYIMEVTLGADWFRDEVEMRGMLRPMQHLHEYVNAGRMAQNLAWNHEANQYMFMEPKHHYCYRGFMDPGTSPAPYLNDALFGKFDGDSDEYEAQDELVNAFVMIPCLRRSSQGDDKVELNSVWYYPRQGWAWTDVPQEVTCGYHWRVPPLFLLFSLSALWGPIPHESVHTHTHTHAHTHTHTHSIIYITYCTYFTHTHIYIYIHTYICILAYMQAPRILDALRRGASQGSPQAGAVFGMSFVCGVLHPWRTVAALLLVPAHLMRSKCFTIYQRLSRSVTGIRYPH